MKKIITRIVILSLVGILIFSLFNIGKIYAEVDKFKLVDVSIDNKSESVDASIINYDKNIVNSKIIYHKVNDFMIYKLSIKNQDNNNYKIVTISDDNTSNYLTYSYEKHENEEFNSGNTKDLLVKITYSNEVKNMSKRNINDPVKIIVTLMDEEGNVINNDVIINPKTGDRVGIYLVLCIFSLIGLVLFAMKRNRKLKKSLLLILLLLPAIVKAATASYVVILNNNIKLHDKLLVKINIDGNEEERIIPYGTKLENIEIPEKDGYIFDNFYDNNEIFDINSIITDDKTIEGKYKLIEYEISYNYDGGTANNPNKYTIEDEITLNNPTKTGYNFSGWTGSNGDVLQTRVTIDKGTTGKKNYIANYSASDNVKYKVIHKYKNLDGTTEDEVENLIGTTDSTVRPQAKSKTGFINPELKDLVIKGDGSSELEYIYERKMLTFNITDRTYVNSSSTENGSYPYGTSIRVLAEEREGYTFKWSDNDTNYEKTFILEENTNLSLIYTIKTYTVSFVTNSDTNIDDQTIDHGGKVTKPTDPTKNRYTFIDWYTNSTFRDVFDFNTEIKSNTTLYAKFTKNDTCIDFARDSWPTIRTNLLIDTTYYDVGCEKEVEIDMNDDGTNESYTVRLSNVSSPEVCSIDSYSKTACGIVIEFVDMVTRRPMNTINTTAGGWKETEMVTWLNNDFYNKLPSSLKEVIVPTYPIVSGSSPVVQNIDGSGISEDITKEDYNINRLYFLSSREVGYNTSYDNKNNVSTDTRTLDYYNLNNNTKYKSDLNNSSSPWLLRTAHSSYFGNFMGAWGSDITPLSPVSNNGVAPAFRIGNIPTYTVSFNTSGGSEINDQSISYGNKVIIPDNPTKEGGTFLGWYTNDNYSTEYDFNNLVFNNMTLYAKFSFITTLTANASGGVIPETIGWTGSGETVTKNVTTYEQYGLLPTPTRDYYDFNGWYTEENGQGTKITSDSTIINENNHSIYAYWTPIKYTIKYRPSNGEEIEVSKGDFVEYDVSYTDMAWDNNQNRYTFTSKNGWRLLDYTYNEKTGLYDNVKLISTGTPAEIGFTTDGGGSQNQSVYDGIDWKETNENNLRDYLSFLNNVFDDDNLNYNADLLISRNKVKVAAALYESEKFRNIEFLYTSYNPINGYNDKMFFNYIKNKDIIYNEFTNNSLRFYTFY